MIKNGNPIDVNHMRVQYIQNNFKFLKYKTSDYNRIALNLRSRRIHKNI